MQKFKVTNSEVRKSGNFVVCAGYCELQNLLYYEHPIAYTCGQYGWNYDVFCPGNYGLLIATGYRGMPGKRARGISAYDNAASFVLHSGLFSYNEKRETLRMLVNEFIELNLPYKRNIRLDSGRIWQLGEIFRMIRGDVVPVDELIEMVGD